MKGINYFLLSSIALMITIVTISSCNKDKTAVVVPVTPEMCPDSISFAGFVEPLIAQNCSTSGCHDAGTAAFGYNLIGYANISANASIILNVIKHDPGVTAMPFGEPKLNDSIIDKFECWKEQGSLDN